MNTTYSKLAQLEKQIQTHCLFPHSQSDVVEINAPEFDPDIDGQLNIHLQKPSHADNTKEPALVTTNSDDNSTLPQDCNRIESQPEPDQSPAEYQNEETIPEQDNRPPPLEDILEL